MAPDQDKPALSVVPADAEAPVEIAPAPPPPPKPGVSVRTQIQNYAALIVELKRQTHLGEGTLTRLIELALNERFTLIQMGLARPNTAPAIEDQHDSENSDAGSEGV